MAQHVRETRRALTVPAFAPKQGLNGIPWEPFLAGRKSLTRRRSYTYIQVLRRIFVVSPLPLPSHASLPTLPLPCRRACVSRQLSIRTNMVGISLMIIARADTSRDKLVCNSIKRIPGALGRLRNRQQKSGPVTCFSGSHTMDSGQIARKYYTSHRSKLLYVYRRIYQSANGTYPARRATLR